MLKKIVMIIVSIAGCIILLLTINSVSRAISDQRQREWENIENLILTQTYYHAIEKEYGRWILSDEENQTIEDLLFGAQKSLADGKVSTEMRICMQGFCGSMNQYDLQSQAILDEEEETFLEMQMDAYCSTVYMENRFAVLDRQKMQIISDTFPNIVHGRMPRAQVGQIECFFRSDVPEEWKLYREARENGEYREAYNQICTLITAGFVPRLYPEDFENERAYNLYLQYGKVPALSYQEAYELATELSGARGLGDIDWKTYEHTSTGITLELIWEEAMHTLIESVGNEEVSKEMYAAQVATDINSVLDEIAQARAAEAAAREAARRRALAAQQAAEAQRQAEEAAAAAAAAEQNAAAEQKTTEEGYEKPYNKKNVFAMGLRRA